MARSKKEEIKIAPEAGVAEDIEKSPAVGLPKKTSEKDEFGLNEDEMTRAGLHLGHRVSRVHPKMFPYIFGVRNTIHLIDLEKTIPAFKAALKFIKEVITKGGTILFVGTKIQAKTIIRELAEECGLPYVNERWLGGALTNYEVMRKRVDYFKSLEQKRSSGELEKYTKKERAVFDKEIARLRLKFEGVKSMAGLPDAVFVADMQRDGLAAKEARMKGIKIIAITDTNIDPSLADYPIPASDDSTSSLKYILGKVQEVIVKSKISKNKV